MAAENQVQFETARVARRVLTKFREDLSAPELYLEPSQSVRDDCLSAVEMLFRCLRQAAGPLPVGPLQQLYTAEFDESQVWEEVQLTNEPALAYLEHVLRGLRPGMQLVARDAEEEQQKEEEETEEEEREDEAEEEGEWEEEEQLGGDEADVGEKSRSRFDDGFFSLAAMERYLEETDQLSDPGECVVWHGCPDLLCGQGLREVWACWPLNSQTVAQISCSTRTSLTHRLWRGE